METRRRTARRGAAVQTAFGAAAVVEEARVAQRAGERRFDAVVQLLEGRGGETLVRFSYATAGSVRRGPLTLRARDLERLRVALTRTPRLAETLGMGGGRPDA